MFTKKTKCGVCGHRFAPTRREIYTVKETSAMAEILTKPPKQLSAIDCPRCGCQIALAIRIPRLSVSFPPEGNKEADDE